MNHNHWLFLMFTAYIAAIFAFGGLYYVLYRRNRGHYSFAADILKNQKAEFSVCSHEELAVLHIQDDIFQELLDRLKKREDVFSLTKYGAVTTLSSGARVELDRVLRAAGGGTPYTTLDIKVYSPEGRELRSMVTSHGTKPTTTDDFSAICLGELEWVRSRTKNLERRLATLDSATPDVWSFVDFLYFSTITQTTVGYGDILPNSSTVRACVIIQILSGYLILAILLNIAFG